MIEPQIYLRSQAEIYLIEPFIYLLRSIFIRDHIAEVLMPALHSSPFVLNSFLSEFSPLLISRGGELQSVCASAGLTPHEVTGANQLIPFDRFIALLEAASDSLGADDFALMLASRQDLRALGPVSLMLRDCETVSQAISVTVSQLTLLVSGISMAERLHADEFIVEIDVHLPGLKYRRQFRDYLVGSTLMVVRNLSGLTRQLHQCQLYGHPQTPTEQAELTAFLGCTPDFGTQRIVLHFPASLGLSPLAPSAIRNPRVASDMASARRHLEASIQSALTYLLVSGASNVQTVASLLGYSERTLRRRLTQHGLSYQGILDAFRLDQANKYLSSTHYRMSDIASLLGFANQSAFSRFYLNSTGLTPSRYRAGLLSNTSPE